jgi:glycosyltransferase involved in cell wall biosynthesis
MNTNPQTLLVSMPIYNAEKTLQSAIESVLGQAYRNILLVMIDDASTDESLEIAKRYLADPRVILLQNQKNMGAYYCRNAGIAYVANRSWGYFTTHDADDTSFSFRYYKLIKALKQDYLVAVQDVWNRVDLESGELIKQSLTSAHAVFKRQVFETLGYFELVRFGADWEYWRRTTSFLKKFNWRTASLKQAMGDSFVHRDNLTTIIPEGSRPRLLYIKQANRRIQSRLVNNQPYQSFTLENTTKRIYS